MSTFAGAGINWGKVGVYVATGITSAVGVCVYVCTLVCLVTTSTLFCEIPPI